jgi:malate synthase
MAIQVDSLAVDEGIHTLITQTANEVGVHAPELLAAFASIIGELAPVNDRLLVERTRLQEQIDQYFLGRRGTPSFDPADYERFLTKIGYIVPEGGDFEVSTRNVDAEFTTAGAQLVCPVFIGGDPQNNARYPLNAVNARWSSWYDALYGKPGDRNVIDENDGKAFTDDYNPTRGDAVVAYVNQVLDQAVPLAGASHAAVRAYQVRAGKLAATLTDGREVGLQHPEKFAGCNAGPEGSLSSVLLRNHGLHIELHIDRKHPIGARSPSGIRDVVAESALTTIIDLEDATCAVDARDKVLAYRNLIGLLRGDLAADVDKSSRTFKRGLEPDRSYLTPPGGRLVLPGRSMMLFRRVGLHMYTDAVTHHGKPIPEGFLDTLVIALASLRDLHKKPGELRNSRMGSVYIVMPKQHGPAEVRLTVDLFGAIEKPLNLAPATLKIGIMDEEQRTSVNLKECVRVARDRIVFINTGFLDRTGDLIHTAMQGGPMETKAGLRAGWLQAYEKNNVQVGLAVNLPRCGQIGKGMWTANRDPRGLVATKGEHPRAGATTAWVPDPKGAALHALHYHQTDVGQVQNQLRAAGNAPVAKHAILAVPFLTRQLPVPEKAELLFGYCQSILGYVVRWVDQGIGCSSVPDHTNTYLMEDRATLRIGSQEIANWLTHGVITEEELHTALARAAQTVDQQNRGDPNYRPLVSNKSGPAFQAAVRLIHEGTRLPNGYVEPVLHAARKEVKG